MTHLTELAPFIAHYGYTKRPYYRTDVVRAASGRTERDSRWAYPLHLFSLPMTNRTQTELETVVDYFHAAAAAGHTFDFLDRSEDRTCALADDPAQDDVALGTATAAQTDFQLIKTYSSGGRTQSRKISRPIASSVLVEKDTVLQTLTTDYTIETGGVIRFVTPLSGGEVIKAGFRFYVPVAFADDDIEIEVHNRSGAFFINNTELELIEVRE